MSDRSVKSIRLNADAQRLLQLLSAYEDKPEGQIVEEALPIYLQMRSLAYGGSLATELANSTPDTVGDIVKRLTQAIDAAIGRNEHAPSGSAKDRLLQKKLVQAR